jgi:hypothetical protein
MRNKKVKILRKYFQERFSLNSFVEKGLFRRSKKDMVLIIRTSTPAKKSLTN